ncbi:MAG: heavy-metal-associated domain-containing protein [Rhodocyclaceae bacterium]|jgi:copper chaperone|uniref:heavy-metal-associated domain-containing protein n=1 Tax=Polaromonas sp. TaxID=1869339 RepID=UPI0025E0098C|nr:heavy metal-associated domain-containing protein [Polaromonas sp.]MBI2725840.1 heavy-metal-associated domain-containing protein [Polaromonas sp.]MBY0341436.1 heavy-metal-associated domain-containing protein [Rhodocyclaceae bacterium]
MSSIELSVEGMTCGSCANAVRKALARVPGVGQVDVDLARGRATVTSLDDGSHLQDMLDAVADAGYKGKPVSGSPVSIGENSSSPSVKTPQRQGGCCCGR